MIAEVTGRGRRGSDTKGLLRYLFGPGRANEHIDPHIVAGWAPEWVHGHPLGGDLADSACSAAGRARLAAQLDGLMTGHDVEVDGGHVYHVVLSLPPADLPTDPTTGERHRLTDELWRELAESGIAALGLAADENGGGGCRWVAVHHGPSANGNDHVHLVVNVVRANGDIANLYRDFFRWRDWCRTVEDRHHWTATAPAGQGATKATSRRELTRAAAGGKPTERDRLRELVATAAAITHSEVEFVQSLRHEGVLLAAYPHATKNSAGPAVTGYKAAIAPADGQEPLWFAGSTLRRDLSLPRLRDRWTGVLPPSLQHMVWREHGEIALPGDAADSLRTLARDGHAVLDAVTAALDTAHAEPHTWHRIAERVADIAAALARHDATGLLPRTHTDLARAAQAPARRVPLRSSEPLELAVRVLGRFARSAARVESTGPATLALGIAVVLLVVIALRDTANHHRIQPAARDRIGTAARSLEQHPARSLPHQPARGAQTKRPRRTVGEAQPWCPRVVRQDPRGRRR